MLTRTLQYTFCSFISRDSTYDVFMNIWRLCNPNAVMSTPSIYVPNGSRPPSINGDTAIDGRTDGATKPTTKGHARTSCGCAAENKHLTETALDTALPGTPEKIQDLMFRSEWLRKFLSENQKLRGTSPTHCSIANLCRSRDVRVACGRRQEHLADNVIHQAVERVDRPKADEMLYHGRTGILRSRQVYHHVDDDQNTRCAQWRCIQRQDQDVLHVGGSQLDKSPGDHIGRVDRKVLGQG